MYVQWCFIIYILQKVPSVPWYKETVLTNIPLGSLAIVVLVRTVLVNLSKLRVRILLEKSVTIQDVYLHSNCLAALANMAPYVQDIHPYAANRLVTLFQMLSKRYNRLTGKTKNGEEIQIITVAESKQEQESNSGLHPGVVDTPLVEGGADFYTHVHEVLK